MPTGAITSYIDVAQLVLYAFWIFFAGLILYLRREDKREGYPLESDRSDRITVIGFPAPPEPKTYRLMHGEPDFQAPHPEQRDGELPVTTAMPWPGEPLRPTGNPMHDAIGPASYTQRADIPDLTLEGEPRVVPMRVATDFSVEERDPDPRGWPVVGADGETGGTVVELWVDRAEPRILYFEVEVGGARVLLPIGFARIQVGRERIRAESILGSQFADVPPLQNPDQITRREEDRICAYFASGHLYAEPSRQEAIF